MSANQQLTDGRKLLQLHSQGKVTAFEEFYQQYRRRLFSFVLAHTGLVQDAEDLLQEFFRRMLARPQGFLKSGDFDAYVFRSLRNQLVDFRKQRDKSAMLAFKTCEIRYVESDGAPLEKVRRLNTALARLPEEHCCIVLMKNYHGMTFDRIGGALEIPSKTVQSRYYLALGKLKEWMSHE
ncbi:RNA polymerase sigma factor [Planctomycetota bacterium]